MLKNSLTGAGETFNEDKSSYLIHSEYIIINPILVRAGLFLLHQIEMREVYDMLDQYNQDKESMFVILSRLNRI